MDQLAARDVDRRCVSVDTILFDAVGTLLEVRGGVGERYAAVAAAHGAELDPDSVDLVFAAELSAAPPLCFPGVPAHGLDAAARGWWRDVVARTVRACARDPVFLPTRQRFEAFFDDLYAHFAGPEAWRPADGAAVVLPELARRGYRLGVLSNSDGRLPGLLASLGLAAYLAGIETSVGLGAAKPDPQAFRRALALIGSSADRAAYVGDSLLADACGAAAAGLLPVLLRRQLPAGVPGLSRESLRDLLNVFAARPSAGSSSGDRRPRRLRR